MWSVVLVGCMLSGAAGEPAVPPGAFVVEAPAYSRHWDAAPAWHPVAPTTAAVRVVDLATGKAARSKVQGWGAGRRALWVREGRTDAPRRYRIEPLPQPVAAPPPFVGAADRLDYGRRRVVRPLGLGMKPSAIPFDWNGDGALDLIYSATDRPSGGTYVYIGDGTRSCRLAGRIGKGLNAPAPADMDGDGRLDLLTWDRWYADVRARGLTDPRPLPFDLPAGHIKGFHLRQVDWDGDGRLDLLAGGVDARGYWADPRYDAHGRWMGAAPEGIVLFYRNTATNRAPAYAPPERLEALDRPLATYGTPSPCAADWDGDGDLDLVCGSATDRLTWFENIGSRTAPILEAARPLRTRAGELRAEGTMIVPLPADWNRDGRPDLVVGQEDGRVSVVLHDGLQGGLPVFAPERFLWQCGGAVEAGVLPSPWRHPDTGDLVMGNANGHVFWLPWDGEAFGGLRRTFLGSKPFRVQAGYHGAVQGPLEAKWGYVATSLGDIDNDGAPEVLFNSSLGRVEWLEPGAGAPWHATARERVRVAWPGAPARPGYLWWEPAPDDLVVQWRSRPLALDWDGDGLTDVAAQDHEGFLALYRGLGDGRFSPGERVFRDATGAPLRLSARRAGKSGRAKIQLIDWDGDGDRDLIRDAGLDALVDGGTVLWYAQEGDGRFVYRGPLAGPELRGHSPAPFASDWTGDGALDLIVGAEDGFIYCYHRAYIEEPAAARATKEAG